MKNLGIIVIRNSKIVSLSLTHPWSDNSPYTLRSSPVGQLQGKSSFRWKQAFDSYQSKSSIEIVSLPLWGKKALQKYGGFHNLQV